MPSPNAAQLKIEGMYQRAMDLRDGTPVRDWPVANREESKYVRAYRGAYNRTHDVEAFKNATRSYRTMLRKWKDPHA